MRIAYLVLAHKNPNQVKRLISLLNDDVYIHIDSKCELQKFYINNPKINYIKDRISVKWGGFSMVEATLRLINASRKNRNYDYYILLSGDDYPIRSFNELESFLMKHRQYSFIEYDEFEDKWQHLKGRYEKYWIFENNCLAVRAFQKIFNLIVKKRIMYRNMKAYKGSQWWCLNSESIDYLLNYLNCNKSIIRYFKYTYIPDEMFFQIILLNSNLKDKIINDNLRYILLEGIHPETLTTKNFSDLINMEKKFFARKFDTSVDSAILDLLDSRI